MPIYVLKCSRCKTQFDFYKIREGSEAVCPKCKATEGFEKLPTAPAIAFKGEGWQTTNFSESVDPTSVAGVKKIEKEEQTLKQKTLYQTRKELTGKRRKVKVRGMKEKKRRFALGKE